jgi:hypothetical protein
MHTTRPRRTWETGESSLSYDWLVTRDSPRFNLADSNSATGREHMYNVQQKQISVEYSTLLWSWKLESEVWGLRGVRTLTHAPNIRQSFISTMRAFFCGAKSCDEKLTPQLLSSKMLHPRPYRERRKSCVFRVFLSLVSHFIPYRYSRTHIGCNSTTYCHCWWPYYQHHLKTKASNNNKLVENYRSCGNPQTFAYVRKLLLSASRPISSVGWRRGSSVFK